MIAINTITSTAVPLPLPNIDTDQIIPKQFLKRVERTGYGQFLFFDWRYDLDTPDHVEERKDFVLNNPAYKGSQILIAEKNFGCGSSREHAAWALNQYGFLAVIAPTFADIFYSNAGKNGIVLVKLSEEQVALLMERAQTTPGYKLTISLEEQKVTDSQGFEASFEIDPFRKFCLIEGLDDIGLTLRHAAALAAFEARHDEAGWLKAKSS